MTGISINGAVIQEGRVKHHETIVILDKAAILHSDCHKGWDCQGSDTRIFNTVPHLLTRHMYLWLPGFVMGFLHVE